MVLTSILVGVAFFGALLALLGASYSDRTRQSDGEHGHDHAHAGAERADECLLCHARLPRFGTVDDAVSEIERRIAVDRTELAGALGGGAAGWVERR